MNSQTEQNLTRPLSAKEVAAYGIYGGGNGVFNYMLNSFGTYFYTNVAGIDSLVAGSFMSVLKVVDFFTDLFMGTLIDTVKNKSGEKARPWLKRAMLPGSLGLILLFTAPFSGGVASLVWAIATYFLATSICFTMNLIPYQALLPLMTDQRFGRTKMEVTYALMGMGISLVAGVSVEPLVNLLGGGKMGWFLAACILAAIAFILHLAGYLGTKENVTAERRNAPKRDRSEIFKELKYLLKNKYWIIMVIFGFASSLSTMAGSMIYYAQYVAGNMGILAYMMILNMGPTMIMLVAAPFIIKKFGKVAVMRIGVICQLVGFVAMWIIGGPAMYAGLVLSAFGMGGSNATTMSFIADSIDYGELKFGVRTEGISYSVNYSVQKMAQALATLLLGALLTWGGYDPGVMVQSEQAILAIKICFCGVPIIISVINLICSILMNVEKAYPDMEVQLARVRSERAAKG